MCVGVCVASGCSGRRHKETKQRESRERQKCLVVLTPSPEESGALKCLHIEANTEANGLFVIKAQIVSERRGKASAQTAASALLRTASWKAVAAAAPGRTDDLPLDRSAQTRQPPRERERERDAPTGHQGAEMFRSFELSGTNVPENLSTVV